ncbi:MAG: 3-oxoacyl-ACP synthase III family protein [Gemmatimonadota bacterium]
MQSRTRTIIQGTGSYLPTRVVENRAFLDRPFHLDYGEPIDRAENERVIEKFREITGISARRWVTDDLVASDMGAAAADAALTDAGIDPETLDYIVVAHNFGDVAASNPRHDFCPTLAARIKQELGIRNPWCVAYDLPFGCPGWLQGVIQAEQFFRAGDGRRALVVGTETLSRVSDPADRDSMLYSDGAGAAVLEAVESDGPVGVLSHVARSDTLEHARLLRMGPSYDRGIEPDRIFLKMRGRKLYQYAVQTVPGVVEESLNRASVGLDDVAKILIHQANEKMDEAIVRRLFQRNGRDDVPERIMPMTISWLGNSSVATLPTLLDLVRRGDLDDHRMDPGDVVVFASVGAGMNVNALVYRVP